MSAVEIIASVLIGAGLLLGVVSAIGLNRFDGVLMRIHAASKPQVLGLILVFAGAALAAAAEAAAGGTAGAVAHQPPGVSPGAGIIGHRSTSSRASSGAQAGGA